jgi:hypothetical protein
MRCVICDRSDNGLSDFRPDGLVYGTHFHEGIDGRIYCSECDDSYMETMGDFYERDLDNEENESAFEFDEGGNPDQD